MLSGTFKYINIFKGRGDVQRRAGGALGTVEATNKISCFGAAALALAAMLAAAPATAGGPLGPYLAGSFGEDGFARYVPPVTNPLFNETPFITTEVKPIYVSHHTGSFSPSCPHNHRHNTGTPGCASQSREDKNDTRHV